MKIEIKAQRNKKTKRVTMEIEVKDLKDLHVITWQMVNNLINGVEYYQNEWKSNKYWCQMEFVQKSDFIEKQIDGKYYRIYKSNIV